MNDVEWLSLSGYGLNMAEKAGLEIGMLQIRKDEDVRPEFWGRITGIEADYLIVCVAGFAKKFYYTTTKEFKLAQMPPVEDLPLLSGFRGDPSALHNEVREELFLAVHVSKIDHDTAVVPLGAYLNQKKNITFQGLDCEQATQLKFYFHFRLPTSPMAKKALETKSRCFLDSLEDDTPKGVWALFLTEDKTRAVLRSLYWPGATAYHEINTPNYASAYVGDGLPNYDLLFMI